MLARGSAAYLVPTAVATIGLGALAARGYDLLLAPAAVAAIVLLFMLWFFRDPERRAADAGVVSPADGKVIGVHAEGETTRVVIFMTPVSVHVNRAPLDGRVAALTYHQGSHVPAFKKESDRNERLEVDLETVSGPVRVRLIAGTVARRIHPYIAPGNVLKRGQRIGLIAFGSRCELTLPSRSFRVRVTVGDWVKAGETPMADEVAA